MPSTHLPGALSTARLFFLLLTGLAGLGLPRLFAHGEYSGSWLGTYSPQWVALLSLNSATALAGLVVLILLFTPAAPRLMNAARGLRRWLARLGWLNLVGLALPWVVFVLLILWRHEKHYASYPPRLWWLWLAVGLGALFLTAMRRLRLDAFTALLAVSLLYGAGVKILGFFPDVSAFPFSLEWSEGSRFFYASLPYAQRLFGIDAPLSSLHPTRYFLLGLPFLFDSANIWLHRLWQVLLWIGLSLGTGWALAHRFRLGWRAALLTALWAFLFVLQGPVYYHLLVPVILILVGFNPDRFGKSLMVVIAASLWAGISRVNWIPVPAMLAIALYLLECPVGTSEVSPTRTGQGWLRTWWIYLRQPAIWAAAGIASALASQAAYVLISGHEDASTFGTSFMSDLLWYRLLPSPTYNLGVLPAVLLATAPLLLLLIANWRGGRRDWHGLRVFGLVAMLGVLFLGGLVVSTKIGGGSNIHNMDAYLALLMVVGGAVGLGRFASEDGILRPRVWLPWPLLLWIILTPIVWNANIGDPFVRRDFAQAQIDLEKVVRSVQAHAAEGEVLFITQRQLAVYQIVPGVMMVPEYELMTLTEMSMAEHGSYLEQFEEDLRSRRFSLIVANRQQRFLRDPATDAFAEENNAWVINIARPLMRYYESELFLDTQGIDMLVPK